MSGGSGRNAAIAGSTVRSSTSRTSTARTSTGGSPRVRCAIYTRKSSEEGLEQDFNSLDAQREACAAYILSQASEGWVALPESYDDGGISGGTLQRPGLQRLLADVAAGRIDTVVVYKVDRLTRSLLDFSKLVEAFDRAGTSFVSVTQSFNTTTSMGRLTLNMLLSFAQFEREVTAERIRDKIAASKAKGMWMGGTPPLGYRPDGRSLAVVEEHAALIRHLFSRYVELGTVRLLEQELIRTGTMLPIRNRTKGGTYGGGQFTRGQIYKILSNPIYIGRIPHGEKSYQGQHPAIVSMDLWDAAQAKLADNLRGHRSGDRARNPSLLAGRVIDQHGEPLIATHATVNSSGAGRPGGREPARRYRYYVTHALHHGDSSQGSRIPAGELEAAVTQRIAEAFDDPFALAAGSCTMLDHTTLASLGSDAQVIAAQLRRRDRALVQRIVRQVRLQAHAIEIECDAHAIAELLCLQPDKDAATTIILSADVTLTRTGRAMRLIRDNGTAANAAPERSLVRLLAQAHRWWGVLREGELNSAELAEREGVSRSYIARIVRLAFLSPAVTDAILAGTQQVSVTVLGLLAEGGIAPGWREQERAMLPRRSLVAAPALAETWR